MNQSTGKEKNNTGREMPESLSGIPAKIIQYLMLVLLLVLVFIVSAYAGHMRNAKDAEKGRGMSDSTEITGETDGTGGENTQKETDTAENRRQDKTDAAEDAGKKGTIVLDAGHGGIDPGVSGASGIAERELNLIFSQKLEKLLTKEGYRVVQTRPTEAGLYDEGQTHKKAQDMQRRCAVIKDEQPLVTISIHQNSYPDSSVSGPQVFYYANSKEGERLAECIQNSMNEQLAVNNPKSHKGNESYYILKRSAGTAVIVECGFLTNPEEEAKLCEEAYQDRAVQAICDGILEYLENTQNIQNTPKEG